MDITSIIVFIGIATIFVVTGLVTNWELQKWLINQIKSIFENHVTWNEKSKRNSEENENGGNKGMSKIVVIGIIALICAAFIWLTMVAVVPAGNVGVKDTFGNVDANILQSGIHLKSPFTGVISMSVQTQKYMDYGTKDIATIEGLSNEGLPVSMGIAVNYHLDPTKAAEVYKSVGAKYENIILVNPIHSVPRDIIAQYDVKTLYSASAPGSPDRVKVENQLFDGIGNSVNKVGVKDAIVIEQVYIRNIDLPQQLKDAISNKLTAEQGIAQKEFDVQRQMKESDRMRAEAQGIADANKIIANSLTPSYLEWYTIEMMSKHTGATYFIPIDSNGRVNPNIVIPVAGDTSL